MGGMDVDGGEAVGTAIAPDIVAVTAGDWVVEAVLHVDVASRLVLFTGTRDSVLERHVYATVLPAFPPPPLGVAATAPPPITRVTPPVGWSAARWSWSPPSVAALPAGRAATAPGVTPALVAATASSLTSPPATVVYAVWPPASTAEPPRARPVGALVCPPVHPAALPPWPLHPPRLFSFTRPPVAPATTPDTLYGALYLPPPPPLGAPPLPPPPVVLLPYGGPRVQLVGVSHDLTSAVGRAVLPALGIAALVVDGRGSGRRGRAWEAAALRAGFGGVEAADQLAGVDAVAAAAAAPSAAAEDGGVKGLGGRIVDRSVPTVDASRVGVVGWSYGGFLALRLLYAPSARVAVAVAGAPVVDWRLYDSAYTERHLGDPAADGGGYDRSSVLGVVAAHGERLAAEAAAAAPPLDEVVGAGVDPGPGSTSSTAAGPTIPGASPRRPPASSALAPSRSRPLLLVHCLGDENVAPAHTGELLDALTAAHVRGVEVLLFPGERHGLRGVAAQVAFEAQALSVLRDGLWPRERRRGTGAGAAVAVSMEPGGRVDAVTRVGEQPPAALAGGAARGFVGRQPSP
eukprot:TRINITY_DN4819_c0_g1_i1.p1 TRINITY_DN4819_c0_g1~~TRINITY_DN4819_c0_g1_i1.p1  ORF type:complete len:574 (+),score=109.96 TRINITY_DN4819_c0_g1_i1:494-2215(+)